VAGLPILTDPGIGGNALEGEVCVSGFTYRRIACFSEVNGLNAETSALDWLQTLFLDRVSLSQADEKMPSTGFRGPQKTEATVSNFSCL